MDSTSRRITAIGLSLAVVATVYTVSGDLVKAAVAIITASPFLLWGFWPDIRRRWLKRKEALQSPPGFDLETEAVRSGDDYVFRLILRPKWKFLVVRFRIHFDAPVLRYRAQLDIERLPLKPEPEIEHNDIRDRWIDMPEIRGSVVKGVGPGLRLTYELISREEITVTKIEQLPAPSYLDD